MTDSSNDHELEGTVPESNEEQTVPVKAVAKERAEKRAAREEATDLRAQLEQLKSENLDMDALIANLSDVVTATSEAAVAKALEPAKQEAEKYKTAVQLKLNEQQADKVFEVMGKYEGMGAQEALTLARSQAPELFKGQLPKAQGFDPSVHGGLPVSGDSPLRSETSENFMQKIADATTQDERTFYAAKEFERRIMAVRSRGPSI